MKRGKQIKTQIIYSYYTLRLSNQSQINRRRKYKRIVFQTLNSNHTVDDSYNVET